MHLLWLLFIVCHFSPPLPYERDFYLCVLWCIQDSAQHMCVINEYLLNKWMNGPGSQPLRWLYLYCRHIAFSSERGNNANVMRWCWSRVSWLENWVTCTQMKEMQGVSTEWSELGRYRMTLLGVFSFCCMFVRTSCLLGLVAQDLNLQSCFCHTTGLVPRCSFPCPCGLKVMTIPLVWTDKMRNTGPNCWILQSREESGMELLDLGYFNHFLQVGRFKKMSVSQRIRQGALDEISLLVHTVFIFGLQSWRSTDRWLKYTHVSVVTLLWDFPDQVKLFHCQCPLHWLTLLSRKLVASTTGWKVPGGVEWGQLWGRVVRHESQLSACLWDNSFLTCLISVLPAVSRPPVMVVKDTNTLQLLKGSHNMSSKGWPGRDHSIGLSWPSGQAHSSLEWCNGKSAFGYRIWLFGQRKDILEMLSSGAEVCIQADRALIASWRAELGHADWAGDYTGRSVFPTTALEPPKRGPTPEAVSIGLAWG